MLTPVADTSQVAQARRLVSDFASQAGTPEPRLGQIALVVTELATNLLKHAGGGEIHAERFEDREGHGVEVMALDRGAGMADPFRCMEDGYSTAGSLGQGLGAVRRMTDSLRVWSQPGRGTAILARFILDAPAPDPRLDCGAAFSRYPGEVVCGDAWAMANPAAGPTLLLVDGTGHGTEAARAAQLAVSVFQKHAEDTCEDLVSGLHRALRPTRGAAIAVARFDRASQQIQYAGIGNICGTIIHGAEPRHMVSHNGIAGHATPRVRMFTYRYIGQPLVILHSDGISSRWDLATYSGLVAQHPAVIAGVLLRDFRRGRDDASVAALRPLS